MAGLLAGCLNQDHIIFEKGPERESDHKALFRCKTDAIGKILGIPFKEVTVQKSIFMDGQEVQPSPRITNMYSKKVTGQISNRSIFNIDTCKRFIPPSNFIDILKSRCKIRYEHTVKCSENFIPHHTPVISTMPLPNTLSLVDYEDIEADWGHKKIYVKRMHIPNCDTYCTVYYPNRDNDAYRASIDGDTLIIESVGEHVDMVEISNSLGIDVAGKPINWWHNSEQPFGKISEINEYLRRKYITDLTLKYGIYSLGRFATWRPKVMLDDVLNDIFVIKRLINNGDYETLKQGVKS